jgi:acyl-CoA thioesterase FadM
VAYLDNIGDDLTVRARLLIGEHERFIYTFSIQCADADLLAGEAVVVLR